MNFKGLAVLGLMMSSTAFTAEMSSLKPEGSEQKPNVIEAMCRVRAKEAATYEFKNCMLTDKTNEMQDMKKSAADSVASRKKREADARNQLAERKSRQRAILIEDDSQVPEPVLAEDPE